MLQLQDRQRPEQVQDPADSSAIHLGMADSDYKSPSGSNRGTEELKLLIVTWNLMGSLPSQSSVEQLLSADRLDGVDFVVIGTQECEKTLFASFFCEAKNGWETILSDVLNVRMYTKVESHVLQGLHLVVFAQFKRHYQIQDKKTNMLKTGFCGLVGNKGGVSIEFTTSKKKLVFINVHLAAHQKQITNRNTSLLDIMQKLVPVDENTIGFIFGDMNYRLDLPEEESKLFSQNSITTFSKYVCKDQMIQQKDLSPFLDRFSEGLLNFSPTYKMRTDRNEYVPSRVPGWTDRIFYTQSPSLRLKNYYSDHNIFGSDHRPVLASFSIQVDKAPRPSGDVEVKMSSACLMF